MDRKSLIAKIKKCLALAKSANEHEAAAALAKARALMDEHGLSELDVGSVEQSYASGGAAQRPPAWETMLAGVIGRVLGSTHIRSERGWIFVGISAAAEIAGYSFSALHRQLKRQRREYIAGPLRRCTPARKRLRADLYCSGWVMAVRKKVAEIATRPEERALIEAYIAAKFSLVPLDSRVAKASSLTQAESRDWWRGHERGRNVDLHHGVGGSDAATPMLT